MSRRPLTTYHAARICPECGYTEIGTVTGGVPKLDGNLLQKAETCPVLKQRGHGMDCPTFETAKIKRGPAV
jgi:hypothetical protein